MPETQRRAGGNTHVGGHTEVLVGDRRRITGEPGLGGHRRRRGADRTGELRAHQRQSLDGVDGHHSAREEGIDVPSPVELAGVVGGIDIEVAQFAETRAAGILDLQDPQARPVVGLVDEIPHHVEVVIDRPHIRGMGTHDYRSVEIRHVPYIGTRVVGTVLFVELVVHQEVALVLREPALVAVRRARVGRPGQLEGGALVGHVDDRQRVFVGRQADLLAVVGAVRSGVDHALNIVRVAVPRVAARRKRCGGGADVHDVQTPGAGIRTHRIREAAIGVDRDVVGVRKARVVGGGTEGDGRRPDGAKLREVEDLHAVTRRLADDEGVVGVDLHVPPVAIHGLRRQVPQVDGICGIADVQEGGAVAAAMEHVLLAVLRVRPPPAIRTHSATDARHGAVGEQIHVVAGIDVCGTPRAIGGLGVDGLEMRLAVVGVRGGKRPVHAALCMADRPGTRPRLHVVCEQRFRTRADRHQHLEAAACLGACRQVEGGPAHGAAGLRAPVTRRACHVAATRGYAGTERDRRDSRVGGVGGHQRVAGGLPGLRRVGRDGQRQHQV